MLKWKKPYAEEYILYDSWYKTQGQVIAVASRDEVGTGIVWMSMKELSMRR